LYHNSYAKKGIVGKKRKKRLFTGNSYKVSSLQSSTVVYTTDKNPDAGRCR